MCAMNKQTKRELEYKATGPTSNEQGRVSKDKLYSLEALDKMEIVFILNQHNLWVLSASFV